MAKRRDHCATATTNQDAGEVSSMVLVVNSCGEDIWSLRTGNGTSHVVRYVLDDLYGWLSVELTWSLHNGDGEPWAARRGSQQSGRRLICCGYVVAAR